MRYVLAQTDKAEAAGFSRETHNTVGVGGTDNMMVITAKGMMDAPTLSGGEADRLKQLGGVAFDNQRSIEAYLRGFNIR